MTACPKTSDSGTSVDLGPSQTIMINATRVHATAS